MSVLLLTLDWSRDFWHASSQFLHQHTRVLDVVDGYRDEMHPRVLESTLDGRHEVVGSLHAMTDRSIGFSIFNKIRIAEAQPPVRERIDGLLPADHAVCGILEDQHDKVQPKS